MLINSGFGEQALSRLDILKAVVEHKKAFFNASYAHYDNCLNKQFHLLPDEEEIKYLKQDYESMIASGMFSFEPIPFSEIMNVLSQFEKEMNQ